MLTITIDYRYKLTMIVERTHTHIYKYSRCTQKSIYSYLCESHLVTCIPTVINDTIPQFILALA